MAENGCTFAIKIDCFIGRKIIGFRLDQKNKLGEELHGQFDEAGYLLIYRHQPNAGTALKEWFEEALEKRYEFGIIDLYEQILTIG